MFPIESSVSYFITYSLGFFISIIEHILIISYFSHYFHCNYLQMQILLWIMQFCNYSSVLTTVNECTYVCVYILALLTDMCWHWEITKEIHPSGLGPSPFFVLSKYSSSPPPSYIYSFCKPFDSLKCKKRDGGTSRKFEFVKIAKYEKYRFSQI